MLQTSRFAPAAFPDLPQVEGVTAATAACAIKSGDQPDLLVVQLPEGTAVGGVFTRSSVTSAAVQRGRRSLAGGRARVLVVHSGNANALTGAQGRELVERMCDTLATHVGCPSSEVFMAGTGIIGQRITDDQVVAPLPGLVAAQGDVAWETAAQAISTTDTFPKGASTRVRIGGQDVVVAGIAKGSGMIAPDMATMLCFLFTDADVTSDELQQAVQDANRRGFARVTVDGDESTSDTMLAFATGRRPVDDGVTRAQGLALLAQALSDVAFDLAMQVVSDGEGIGKLIEVTVRGARTPDDAAVMARAVADSPLVKTAIGGGHPNWGRIAMAVGKTHRPVAQERLGIWLGPHRVAHGGDQDAAVDETALAQYMAGERIEVTVDVGTGSCEETVWTCDLTHGYVDINAHYTT